MEKKPMGSDDFTDITPPSKQSEPSPPLLVFGIVCVIVFFGFLFVLRQSPETPMSPRTVGTMLPRPVWESPPVVTKAAFDQIRPEMTYLNVMLIIGDPGEEISRSDIAGYTTIMYSWVNSNGSKMNAMFQNNSLVSKAQFGLR